MQYSVIIDRVRDYLDRDDLGTSASPSLSATRIGAWINDTRNDIAIEYKFDYLYVEATMQTSANSGVYALPVDYLGSLSIWSNNFKLAKVGGREFDELTGNDEDLPQYTPTLFTETDQTSGAPTYYIDRGMNIQLWPTPDGPYTVLLKYYSQPSNFVYTTDEDYISRFHFEAIIFGAALRGAVFLDDMAKQQIFEKAYVASIQKMVKREKEKVATDAHVRVKSWMDYNLNTFKRLYKIDNSG